jgi:hypothetical protein
VESSGNFSVKSFYNIIAAINFPDMLDYNLVIALNELWMNNIPSKIDVFGWRLLHNKLATRGKLFNKRIITDISLISLVCFAAVYPRTTHIFFFSVP